MNHLAVNGGAPAVSTPHPHEPWPPPASPAELERIARQRNLDIGIRGNAGPIGELETLFRDAFLPARHHSIAFNSGTSAIFAAYLALGVGVGDEIIAPVLTYHAAVSPARLLGATIKFVDIDEKTRGLDPASIEKHLSPRTKAIVVVHQWGRAADLAPIMDIANRHNIPVIEDCSHAHGSLYEGAPVGTFGRVAVFSLQANKAVFAGEGGILVTDDQELADRAILTGHYRDRARDDVRDEVLRRYWESGFGLKLRMSPFNAIVGIESVRAFPELARSRQRCLSYFNDRLSETGLLEPVDVPDPRSMGAWYGFKPMPTEDLRTKVDRSTLVRVLRAEGVEVDAPSGRLLARLPLYGGDGALLRGGAEAQRAGVSGGKLESKFPVGSLVERHALSLPTFYRWPSDRIVIDEYLRAFDKVAPAISRGDFVESAGESDTGFLPRDAAGHGR